MAEPEFRSTAEYRDALVWATEFLREVHEQVNDSESIDGAALLRSQQEYVQFARATRQNLIDRLWQIGQHAATLAALLVTGIVGLKIEPTWPLRLAFCAFVLATLAAAWGRKSTWIAGPAGAPMCVAGLRGARRPDIAEAVGLFLAGTAMNVEGERVAWWLDAATGLFCLGVALLLFLLF